MSLLSIINYSHSLLISQIDSRFNVSIHFPLELYKYGIKSLFKIQKREICKV